MKDNRKQISSDEEKNDLSRQTVYYDEDKESDKAGVLGLICSALFPVVGVVLFLANKNRVENRYLYLVVAAIAFFIAVVFF